MQLLNANCRKYTKGCRLQTFRAETVHQFILLKDFFHFGSLPPVLFRLGLFIPRFLNRIVDAFAATPNLSWTALVICFCFGAPSIPPPAALPEFPLLAITSKKSQIVSVSQTRRLQSECSLCTITELFDVLSRAMKFSDGREKPELQFDHNTF